MAVDIGMRSLRDVVPIRVRYNSLCSLLWFAFARKIKDLASRTKNGGIIKSFAALARAWDIAARREGTSSTLALQVREARWEKAAPFPAGLIPGDHGHCQRTTKWCCPWSVSKIRVLLNGWTLSTLLVVPPVIQRGGPRLYHSDGAHPCSRPDD